MAAAAAAASLSQAVCRKESPHSATLPHKYKRAESRSTDWARSWHRFIRSPNPLVLWHRGGVGVTDVPCSSLSPELPLETCLCEKGLTPAKPPASSFLPCFFRPQNNNSICAIHTAACGFLLSLYTCYWTSPEQKSDSKALQDGRKEVSGEAMCTLLSWVRFSTPIIKEEKHGSVLQTLLERHLNLINATSTSFARRLQSTKLGK